MRVAVSIPVEEGLPVSRLVELGTTDDLDPPAGYTLERARRYGSAKFLFLRHSNSATASRGAAPGRNP